jgi:enoyl-CoA hydratase
MQNIKMTFPYHDPHVAMIQLNRPKVLNALSTELMNELVAALFTLDDNPQVRVIILTGDERAFAAGADIAQMVTANSH